MVDRGTLAVIGSMVTAIGLGLAALSGRLARSHADYLRSGRRRPRPIKVPPFDRPQNERYIRAGMVVVGLLGAVVGGMWIAGIGAR
jgi:hypothetical protein